MAITPEQFESLSAPFPKSAIKSFKGRGGMTMRYIDVGDIEARIAEVDPNYHKQVVPGARSVAVHYTILGVTRGDLFDNDSETNKYGAPQVNALARASRRAARMFGVGKEVWEKEEEVVEDDEDDEEEAPRPKKSSGGGKGVKFSPGQLGVLKDKGFTDDEIASITSYDIVKAAMNASGKGERIPKTKRAELIKQANGGSKPVKKSAPVIEDDFDEDEDE